MRRNCCLLNALAVVALAVVALAAPTGSDAWDPHTHDVSAKCLTKLDKMRVRMKVDELEKKLGR